VQLKAGATEIFVGEAIELTIEVQDFQSCQPPVFPDVPGATVRQIGMAADSSYTTIINGRVTQSRTRAYSYELTPLVIGELVIPPVPVSVDGQELHTKPLRLQVRPSDAHRLFAIEITAGRKRIYVGQRVELGVTIWVRPPRYGNQVLDADSVLRRIQAVSTGSLPPLEFRQVVRRPRPDGDPSELYYAYEFTATFVPERAGTLSFDDVELGMAYPTRGGNRQLRARPSSAPLEVLPVPMQGRPPDFAGAVGLLDIETRAEPVEVGVGDPIELTIDIFGEGPLESLPPPLLSANARLANDFRLPSEQLAGEVRDARRRFRLTIRAKRDDVTEIPPIEYPYFDPDAERFVIARSDPIPLVVRPAQQVAPPELNLRPGALTATPLQTLDGLHDIETREDLLLAQVSPIEARHVLAVALIPPAVYVLTWTGVSYVRRRTGDPARLRRQRALPNARRRIRSARALPPRDAAGEIAAALRGYWADRLNEPPGRFTGATGTECLRAHGVKPTLVEQWAAVLARCEEAVFAGGATDVADLATQAWECLKALERQKL